MAYIKGLTRDKEIALSIKLRRLFSKVMSKANFLSYLIQGLLPIASAIWIGYHHRLFIKIKDPEMKQFIRIFMPIMGSALLMDLNMFVDRFLASSMQEGSISSLNYASRLTTIFDTLLVVGLGVVILPMMSQINTEGNREKFIGFSVRIIKLSKSKEEPA